MTVSNIYKLLDKMEMTLLKGGTIPLTPWVVVHQDKVLDILDKIRASIPGEIQEANVIIKKRDEVQMEAHNRAEQIVNEAKAKAQQMIAESEILKSVKAEAEKIREEVISECRGMKEKAIKDAETIRVQAINESISIREGADRYAQTVLDRLEDDLAELTEVVDIGQKQLAKLKTDSMAKVANYKSQLGPQLPPKGEDQIEPEGEETIIN